MKRILVFTLIFAFIISALPTQTAHATVNNPSFSIDNMDIPVIDPGKSTKISLTLKNAGGQADDVRVTPEYHNPEYFISNKLTNSISLGNVYSSKSVPLNLDITASPNALPGDYQISLKVDYSYYEVYSNDPISVQKRSGQDNIVISVRISDKSTAPKLLITKTTTDPEVILPGQDLKLNIAFENRGTVDANNINIRLEGLKSNGGFYIAQGADLKHIKVAPGSKISNVSYDLKAANNIPRGTHELEVIFEYGGVTEKQKIYLVAGGSNDQASNLVMENLQHPTAGIGPNKDFVIKFDLRNNSTADAANIIIKAESSDSAVVPKTTSIIKVNSLKAGESKNLSFTFFATDNSSTQNYPINISVEYEDDFNNDLKHTINQYVGMYVSNDDSSSTKGKPKLIIEKYSFEPQLVKAGENFEMNLSFYNTNSTKTVRNIKIFLTAEPGSTTTDGTGSGSAFTPVDSSNTFYIDSIAPKGRVEKTITMFVVPDAIAKTHTITANFEYEDNEGNELRDVELIGVPVVQQSKLDLGEVGYMPEAYIGQSTPISLEFYNTGKVTLYNMMVKLEGDFQSENAQYYVGNFTSGSSDYFEGYVIPMEMGELKGDVVFTYEDSTGQMQEVRKEFSLNVMEMPVWEDPWGGEMPPMEEPQSGGLLKSKWLWITLGATALIGGTIVYRKKKKSKELSLDE